MIKSSLLKMKNKKILLIDPIYNSGDVPPNVSLGKIEAQLSAHYIETTVLDFVNPMCEFNDLSFFKKQESDFLNRIQNASISADIAYITLGHGNELKPYPQFPRVHEIAKKIKKTNHNTRVIVGGALINLYKKVYKISDSDLMDGVIDNIVDGNENKVSDEILKLYGINKDTSAYPTIWMGWNHEKYPEYRSLLYHVGCPYNCDFCFEGKIFDKKQNVETLESFIKTISHSASQYGTKKFIIEDSTLMSYPDFDELVFELRGLNLQISAYARISEIIKHPEKVKKMQSAGFKSLIVGVETLNDDILKKHSKGLLNNQTRLGLGIIKDNGLEVQGCFMLGFPDDTLNNMERTIDFSLEEKMNGYRWHIYQPNFRALDNSFYAKGNITANDHINSQLNVPDHCLADMMHYNPEIGIMDEHFLIRAKNVISESDYLSLKSIGYKGKFSYYDVFKLLNKFPQNMILNEEKLYKNLFINKAR